MKFLNLTPHPVNLVNDTYGNLEIPPSGKVARLKELYAGHAFIKSDDPVILVELTEVDYGESIDLPEQQPGQMLIVSLVIALANPERPDLVFPYPLIRDESGRVIGSGGFGRIA